MTRFMTQRLTLCCLFGFGLLQGCVGEVDLQVLRADMETLKDEYRQHDEAINRQLETLESRMATPIQELEQTATTLSDLQEEANRLRLSLQDLQQEADGTRLTKDIEATFAYLETRLDQIERHPVVINNPTTKPSQTQLAATQPAAQPTPSASLPAAKRDQQEPATPSSPPAESISTDTTPSLSKPAQQPQVTSPSTQVAKAAPSDSPPPQQEPPSASPAAPEPQPPSPDAQQQADAQQEAASPQTAPTYDSDVRLYEKALRTYQAGDYEGALVLLRHFLNQYADSTLAGNVQYWIGESLYAQRHYQAAIGAFNDVVQRYPDDTKVPAAMLNQGLAFAKLRNVKQARYFLQQVQEKYADSFEADQAAATLKELSR